MSKPYPLGVLFVHGIGQSARGDTLVRFGEPLCIWIDRWLGRQADTELFQTDLHPTPEQYKPPSTELRISRRVDDKINRTTWLLAESWWKNAFATPKFADMAKWAYSVVPWTIAGHFAVQLDRVMRAPPRSGFVKQAAWFWRLVAAFLRLVLGGVLSAILFSIILILFVLAIPPIPRVRSLLLRLQRALALTIGDSYILLESPIQSGAVVSQVRRDIDWVASQCDAIAIVAHSQGACIAFDALQDGLPKGVDPKNILLFTFGSGLAKLQFLRVVFYESGQEEVPGISAWAIPAGLVLLIACGAAVLKLPGFAAMPGLITFYCGLAGFGFLLTGVNAPIKKTRFSSELIDRLFRFPDPSDPAASVFVRWRDCHASHDPVSNGPVLPRDTEHVRMNEVWNLASAVADHTTYWKNADQFIARLACDLASMGGVDFESGGGSDLMQVAALRRQWRVRSLASMRLVFYALGLLALGLHWRELYGIGDRALAYASTIVASLHSDLLNNIFHSVRTYGPWAAGAVAVLAPVLILQQLLYRIWTFWDWCDIRRFYNRSPFTLSWPFLVYAEASVVAAAVAIAYSAGWTTALWDSRVDIGSIMLRAGMLTLVVLAIREWRLRYKLIRARRKKGRSTKMSKTLQQASHSMALTVVLAGVNSGFLLAPALAALHAYGVSLDSVMQWTQFDHDNIRSFVAAVAAFGVTWTTKRLKRRWTLRGAVGSVSSVLRRIEPEKSPAAAATA